jgi:8-hydroxy-5-deazaflavin:NADPH oxidoreductase
VLVECGLGNVRLGDHPVDGANPLDFSAGMPRFIHPDCAGPTSLGEAIQSAFPKARVVRAFNTIAAAVIVNPGLFSGRPDLMLSGDDAEAKALVGDIARSFGWKNLVDLGDITGARAQESVLPVWVRLWMVGGSPLVALKVARA